MTSRNGQVGRLVQRLVLGVLVAATACQKSVPPATKGHPSYAQLLKEAQTDYSYADAGPPVPGDPNVIGKFGAVAGVTMQAYSAKKTSAGSGSSREVVARFDLNGGDYDRLGMYQGKNYVFLEHDNEHSKGAIMTRAYYVVAEGSQEIRYLLVDKRINVVPGAHTAPVVATADPFQGLVFGGCVEGSFCPNNHCSVTDAGDVY